MVLSKSDVRPEVAIVVIGVIDVVVDVAVIIIAGVEVDNEEEDDEEEEFEDALRRVGVNLSPRSVLSGSRQGT